MRKSIIGAYVSHSKLFLFNIILFLFQLAARAAAARWLIRQLTPLYKPALYHSYCYPLINTTVHAHTDTSISHPKLSVASPFSRSAALPDILQ